ncbi:signal recognition particle [Youhaiella tibetensis]|uniref:Signal recognition particle n=2 Tax=Paradevosia tibetensis TaxID=1447062 RepID=A0A5B9DVJ1_9HYPH|nr:signal recognition particle [Youhaiella tibetensis]
MKIATALGTVLASEKLCGLSYDQAAISAFIESNVPADDMDFPATLQMMIQGQGYNLKGMSESAKTAHCTQIARTAKSYKFIQ